MRQWRSVTSIMGATQRRQAPSSIGEFVLMEIFYLLAQSSLPPAGLKSSVRSLLARKARAHPHPWPYSPRSEEHTSELQSLMRISYAVFCLKKKKYNKYNKKTNICTE